MIGIKHKVWGDWVVSSAHVKPRDGRVNLHLVCIDPETGEEIRQVEEMSFQEYSDLNSTLEEVTFFVFNHPPQHPEVNR